jgi:NAD(P)-dependent dehydrogenase (short-subunit alcohol dehydrogenase family)
LKLAGRVALVTGGGSGIGMATAQRLAIAGMRVCVADVNHDAAVAVADGIDGLAVACDVSDAGQVAGAYEHCVNELGGVDLAVLNAGITIRWSGDIGSLDLADYRKSLGVNLDGVVFGVVEAVRAMRNRAERADGAIVATASLSGLMPWYPDPVYSLGKHGVVGFMRSVAPSLAADGIAVHTVCPGITATGALGNRRALVEGIGVPVMEPEVIADTIVMAATRPLEDTGTCWVARYGKAPHPMSFPDMSGPDDPLNRPVTRR